MAERLFGVEREYAVTALNASGQVLDRAICVGRLSDLAKARLPHLCGLGGMDLFLANGSRLYVDTGCHPEFCTPECANPWDVVRYLEAGETILGSLAEELENHSDMAEVALFKCNVDYGGTGNTWGCHESYLHRTDPRRLPSQIIPHLVSRVIYTGAGGFNVGTRGLEFTLSPRVAHLVQEVSDASTHERGIFHTKNESLSLKGYGRLHVLCGESLCSQLAAWLQVGTTALVVAMIDAGLKPGDGFRLRSSLSAMQTFAADPTCSAAVPSAKGESLTARMIQYHYLEQAEAHIGEDFMPPWAGEVCRRWRETLDLLSGAPQSVATKLDWAIKRAIFQDYVERNGVPWQSLSDWSCVCGRLRAALDQTPYKGKAVATEFLLGPQSPIGPEMERLGLHLNRRGMKWDGLKPFVQLRPAMFEIDTRFGQLGGKGIFSQMDRQGVLDHAVHGVDNVEHAISHPPAIGRAKIRAEWVHRLAGSDEQHVATWDRIIDLQQPRELDLADPFAARGDWQEMDDRSPGVEIRLMETLWSRHGGPRRADNMRRSVC
jgi:proteasome accessory factor A